jgi:hypothetical protein
VALSAAQTIPSGMSQFFSFDTTVSLALAESRHPS